MLRRIAGAIRSKLAVAPGPAYLRAFRSSAAGLHIVDREYGFVGSKMSPAGLEAVFLTHRESLLRFLRAHGAADDAEDLLHELWLRVRAAAAAPIAQPLSYLYRAANNLMLDRYRSDRQAAIRARAWSEATGATVAGHSDEPAGERVLIARQDLDRVRSTLATLGPRAEQIFRRHRLDGVPQRMIAAELGISLSTVESDLRKATRLLIDLRAAIDQGSGDVIPSRGGR